MRNYYILMCKLHFPKNLYINFLFGSTNISTSLQDSNDMLLATSISHLKLTCSRSDSSLMPRVTVGLLPSPYIVFLLYHLTFFLSRSYKLLSSWLVCECALVSRKTWWELELAQTGSSPTSLMHEWMSHEWWAFEKKIYGLSVSLFLSLRFCLFLSFAHTHIHAHNIMPTFALENVKR